MPGRRPEGSDPAAGQDVEKELANQEVAEPREAPVQSTEAGGEPRRRRRMKEGT